MPAIAIKDDPDMPRLLVLPDLAGQSPSVKIVKQAAHRRLR
jgi:hypothetical protein